MAKSKQNLIESGFSFEELAEEVVKSMGGIAETAKLITEGAKTADSLFTKEKYITLIARILRQAMPRQEATDALTDDEIERALTAEWTRHFVSMDEDDYRATIERIEKTRKDRKGETQNAEVVQQSQETHSATPAQRTAGKDRGIREGTSEESGSPVVESDSSAADDRDAATYRRIERGE